ncbi:MAG: undecaprenyl-diphosphate phosphatase [Treponema sp.]
MTVIQGIVLGIVQGIAEFLPVSSSGHLAAMQKLLALDDVPLLFDVVLHLATLAAVVLYFRTTIAKLFAVLWRWVLRKSATGNADAGDEDALSGSDERGRRTIIAVFVTTFITGAIGVFTSKLIPDLSLKVTAAGFIVTAGLLILSAFIEKRRAKTGTTFNSAASQERPARPVSKGISVLQAAIIGVMQGLGTLPGISRSGSTIAGALFGGLDRASAGEYSFIVSIPAILGAFVLELKDFDKVGSAVGAVPVIAGCAAAFLSGYIALSALMKIIKKGRLDWFAVYLIPLGIAGLIFF